jgi:hypothetical protein
MLTEFGCLNPSFPTINGFQAQRNFLQVDTMFSQPYAEEFAGGFVFEYSTEEVYSKVESPYPFTNYGPGNYGVGYFTPDDCDDITTNCNYVRFPQFDTLAAKYAAVDSSGTMDSYTPPQRSYPQCPAQFAPLNSFVWPSFSVDDWGCPDPLTVYCPNISVECVPASSARSALPSQALLVAVLTAVTTFTFLYSYY